MPWSEDGALLLHRGNEIRVFKSVQFSIKPQLA